MSLETWMQEPLPPGNNYVDIVFDGPPSHYSGRFVEVEDASGRSIRYGEWIKRPDGLWALRLPRSADAQ